MPSKKAPCPTCDGLKDSRAFQCKSCQFKFNHPRKGTGAGVHKNGRGYLGVMVDNKAIFQHRAVMEKSLGRKLSTLEHIHHINGDTTDNRIENLELIGSRRHHQLHTKDQDRDEMGRFV